MRALVAESLVQRGYKVVQASDADQALAMSDRHHGPIELLLTDLRMPEISGHELARRMRVHRPEIKVIYMSGYSSDAIVAIDRDGNFLEKPFRPEQLIAMVRKVLDS